jgi:regulator of protease activity HflC (stomatin/prohibitin superfamily)
MSYSRTYKERSGPRGFVIAGTILCILFLCSIVTLVSGTFTRVDPGYAGVLVDYAKGTTSGQASIQSIPTGQYRMVNPVTQKIAQYPIAQQTLTMVRNEREGKVQGDDSVVCQDRNGIQISQDVTILWRVDPEHVGQLYLLRPGVKLSGDGGNDIEDMIVRRETRNAVVFSCGSYTYDQMYDTAQKVAFSDQVTKLVAANLKDSYIIVDKVSIGELHPGEAQRAALENKAKAQQDAQTAVFLKQKAQAEADAAITTAQGAQKVVEIQTQASANAKVTQAQADKQAFDLLVQALGGPANYLQWLSVNKWDGKLPSTQLGNDTPFLVGANR